MYEKLLSEIDLLANPDRLRLLARRARLLVTTGTAGAVLDELYDGDLFRRETAVFMVIVAECQPVVVAALDDPDSTIREMAIRAWLRSRWPTRNAIATLLEQGSRRTRRQVYRSLRKWPQPKYADGLIEEVRCRHGHGEAAELLPGCSAGMVARQLPELGYALTSWLKLAQRYPAAVLDVAGRQLAELSAPGRNVWWHRFGDGVMVAAPALPHQLLTLLETYGLPNWLPARSPYHQQGRPRLFRQYADLAAHTAPREHHHERKTYRLSVTAQSPDRYSAASPNHR